MAPGFQVAGQPSALARLRGEKPVYPQSRVGNNSSLGKIANSHLPNTPSNLRPYSQAHTRAPKAVVTDPSVPDDGFYDVDSSPKSQNRKGGTQNINETSKSRRNGPQSVVDSIGSLSLGPPKQPESVAMGRCLGWERPGPKPSNNSRASKYAPRLDRDYPKTLNSEYSISYKRRANQTPMEQAGHREYLPFLKSEFKIGTIIRMNIHESDFKGTTKETPIPASQASTLVEASQTGGPPRRPKEHRSHGDFGPIYSENRICIVVNVAHSLYAAIPLFTHQGKGLSSIHPDERRDYISVQDHRLPDPCPQQSEHAPLRTAYMNPQAAVLNKVSTAWIPYAVPCRFDVPVAYQGSLDEASVERLVRLYRMSLSLPGQG